MTSQPLCLRPTALPLGAPLQRLLDVARDVGAAVLLEGPHGIGKSEFLEHYAQVRGLKPKVLDLSLLEAPDLTGLPYRDGAVTRYARPSTLPHSGSADSHLLVLEELNRCDRSVRQPCLQLLTTRRLNDYVLPDDCQLVACINPADGDYETDRLDPALASRFLRVPVVADRDHWLSWASQARVPEPLLRFVRRHRGCFDQAPPRSWVRAAQVADAARQRGYPPAEVEAAVACSLSPVLARAYVAELGESVEPLPAPEELLLEPADGVRQLKELTADGRLDAVVAVVDGLVAFLDGPDGSTALEDPDMRRAAERLAAAAPWDLAGELRARLNPAREVSA